MKRWQYKIIHIVTDDIDEIKQQLDRIGNQGWELSHRINYQYTFKREMR